MSAIFYENEEQKEGAEGWKEHLEQETGRPVRTQILPLETFYLAEAYHQKYWLRMDSVFFQEYKKIYPSLDKLLQSTAVARVNGYLGGYGTLKELEAELLLLGLSEEGQRRLRNIVLSR
jgi:hypothetical protein